MRTLICHRDMALPMLRLLSQPEHGAPFDDNDAMFVLELLERALRSGEAMSRADISGETGIGEGVVRAILQRLRSIGLLSISRAGTSISMTGLEFMRATGVSLMRLDHTDSAIGAHQVALLVKGKAAMIEKGIEQRNCALKVGADGCTTIVCEGGALVLPPDWDVDERTPELASQIRRHGISDGDVVLIGGSDTGPRMASAASNSAALALLTPRDGPGPQDALSACGTLRHPGDKSGRRSGSAGSILTGPPPSDSTFLAMASTGTPVARDASTQPAPSEYIDTARRRSSSLSVFGPPLGLFQDVDLHLGHLIGMQPPRGTQTCPHLLHSTSFLMLTFHSVDLHEGHLRGTASPRLFQACPHTMHMRSVLHGFTGIPSRNSIPQ